MTTLTSAGGETFPSTVIATTGSYTVPSGSFAILRGAVSGGRSLAINGTTVMAADNLTWTTQRVLTAVHASGIFGTSIPRLYVWDGSNNTGNIGDAYGNSTAYNRNSSTQTYKLPSGTVISGNAYKLIEVY